MRVKSTAAGLVALALFAGCGAVEGAPRGDRDARSAAGGGARSEAAADNHGGTQAAAARSERSQTVAGNRGASQAAAGGGARMDEGAIARARSVPGTPAGVDPRVAVEQGLIATPIGRGPEFQPPAQAPDAGCAPGAVSGRYRAHVEVFGRKQAVVIPAGIGVGAGAKHEYGRVVGADCRAAARTLDPSGVVHFDRSDLRLGDLFAVWGQPLDRGRVLAFRGEVSAFVGGRRVTGDPARIALRDGAQIVLESGGYIPPHPAFRFPPRSRPSAPQAPGTEDGP